MTTVSMLIVSVVAVVVTAPLPLQAASILNGLIELCNYNDPKIGDCLVNRITDVLPKLKNGEKTLKLPVLEPFRVEKFKADTNGHSISVNLTLENTDVTGLTNTKLTDMTYDQENQIIRGNFQVPKVVLDGQYEIDGKVLILPIVGKGKSTITLENVDASLYMKLEGFSKKDSKRYVKIKDIKLTAHKVGNIHVNFENLFNGNKELSTSVHQVLNENKDAVFDTFKEPFEKLSESMYASVTNKIFAAVPFAELLPGANI